MLNRIKLAAIFGIFEVASWSILRLIPKETMYFVIFGSGFSLSPDVYYIVAGIFSFLILPAIARVGCDQLVIDILKLALIVLAVQFAGFIFYNIYFFLDLLNLQLDFDPQVLIWKYNDAIKFLLTVQFLRLLIIRKSDGIEQNNNYLHALCRWDTQRSRNLC